MAMHAPPVEYIELNLANYGPDDVSQLNEWAIWANEYICDLETNADPAGTVREWRITKNENESLRKKTAAFVDLLAACKAMCRAFGNCGSPAQQEAADMAFKAIAKAEEKF